MWARPHDFKSRDFGLKPFGMAPGVPGVEIWLKNFFAKAEIIALGLSRDKVTIRFPWQMSIVMKVLSLLPSRIFTALTRRMVS